MTDDLHSIQLLLAHAERQRDEAIAELVRLETTRRAAEAQAEQLLMYRREYEQRWGAEFSREGKIELVRCYQGFVERLTSAVDQQQRIAAHATSQVERATAMVRGHDMRAASLKKVIERRQLQAGRDAGRAEQKDNDELAARVAWRRQDARNVLGAA